MIEQTLAIKAIKQYASQVWKTVSFAYTEDKINLMFAGIETSDENLVSKFWARLEIAIPIQKRANLGEIENLNKRRYRNEGVLSIDVYCPKSKANSYEIGRTLCSKMRAGFADKRIGEIDYMNPRVDDSYRTDKSQYILTFYCDFTFDEVIGD